MAGISARERVIVGEYSTRLFKGNRMLPQVRGGLSWIPVEAHTVPRLLYLPNNRSSCINPNPTDTPSMRAKGKCGTP